MNEDLKCLPTDFVGISRPSKKIQAFYERKAKEEKEALRELEATKKEICSKYELFIESDTKVVKKKLEDIRELIKEELFQIKEDSNEDNANYIDKRHFNIAYKHIQTYVRKQFDLVEDFYLNLMKLEKLKAKEITTALRKTYNEIKLISLKLPYECEETIELEIEKVNQTIINNNHNFVELKTKLQGDIQQHNKKSIQELWQVKDCWVKFVRLQAIKSLGNLKKQYNPSLARAIESLHGEVNRISDQLIKIESVNQIPDASEWLEEIRQTLARVDTNAQKIILSYKQAAVLVYNKVFQDLSSIGDALEEIGNLNDKASHAHMYTPDLDDIVNMYDAELETIQKLWSDLVNGLTKITEDTYRFLKAASTLWRIHFKRTETLQVVMLKDLENTVKSNNSLTEINELKLNVLIDTLRQAPARDKLKKILDEINKLLASMAEQYKTQYQAEVGILKKYKSMHEFRADILLMEINRFLEVYPPDMGKDPKIQRRRASQTSEIIDPTDGLIPNQMLFLKYQAGAIGNWQFGLWECIKNYTATAKTEVLAEVDKWIQSHVATLDKRLEIRLGIHAMRLERIRVYIHDERLEELCKHQNRFEEHKSAVVRRIAVLQDELLNYQDVVQQIINLIKSELLKASMAIVHTNNSYEVTSRKAPLKAKFDEQIGKINEKSAGYLKTCNDFVNNVKGCHVYFLENIKLFCEEGNFCPQEVQDLFRNIEKLEAQVEKAKTESSKKVESFKESVLQEVNQQLEDLCGNNGAMDQVIKEHTFREAIENKIKELQRELIMEACKFESRKRQMVDNFGKFKKEIIENCGDHNYIQTFYDQLHETAKQLTDLGEFLLEDQPFKLYSDKTVSDGDMPVHFKKDSANTRNHQVESLEMQLFNYSVDEQDQETLWMKFNGILLNSWKQMKRLGDSFYAEKKNNFLDASASKIPDSLEALVKNFMYCRFHRLQNQCETKVMQLTREFIYFVGNFCTVIQEYIDMYPNEYSRKTLKNFEQFCQREIRQKLQGHKNQLIEQYGNLQKRLKPLYGHPRNIKLLEKLEIEAEILRSETKELFTDIKIPYLEKMAAEYSKSCDSYMDIKSLLPQCCEVINALQMLIADLSLKLNFKVQLAQQMVECGYNVRDEIKPIIDHTKKFLESFDSETTQQKSAIDISNKQHSEMATDTRWSESLTIASAGDSGDSEEYSDGYLIHSGAEQSNTTVSTGEMDICLMDLKDSYIKCTKEFKGEKLDELLETLAKEWRFAVTRVLELYTLKYD